MPVWDYSKIPGTTAREQTDEELSNYTDWPCKALPNSYSGGLKQGPYGVIYEQAEHDGIKVNVSYFLYPDAMIMLGSGIKDEFPEKGPLFVTLNQCRPEGKPVCRADGSVEMDGFVYRSLDGKKLLYRVENKNGAWHRNNLEEPFAPVSMDVFTIEESLKGVEDTGYAVQIENSGKSNMAATVISNTESRHEVLLATGVRMIVDFSVPGGLCQIIKE